MTSSLDARRARVANELEELAPLLDGLALELHRQPELGCREVHTVTRLAGELEEEGFAVETGVGGLPTAFRAERGAGGPRIAFLAEYDAIPGLGHACGHNLLVAATYGAAVALARATRDLSGTIAVIGAPAEETIGGKVVLAARGAYDGLDAALLAHPGHEDRAIATSLASWSVEVVFTGRSAHAVAAPEQGKDALDALIRLFVARDALLRELPAGVRMPGVILEGGVRPNLVPERARARFSLRAADARTLAGTVLARFRAAVDEIARATGTAAAVMPIDNLYDALVSNDVLAERWTVHARAAGLAPADGAGRPVGSLDIGTLSHRVPVLHPFFRVGSGTETTHTRGFATLCATPEAAAAARRAALALALTGLDLVADPALLERVRAAHARVPPSFTQAEPLVVDQPDA